MEAAKRGPLGPGGVPLSATGSGGAGSSASAMGGVGSMMGRRDEKRGGGGKRRDGEGVSIPTEHL